jgi:hypothetical protein
MSKTDEYRAKAIQFAEEAQVETDPQRRTDLEWLAESYRRLAEHADEVADIVDFTPPQQVPQVQQQPQTKLGSDDKPTPKPE